MDFRNPPGQNLSGEVERPYAETVAERYAVETDMVRAIEQGNTARALLDWQKLHQRMEYLKKQVGYSMETCIHSAAITRTVVRMAGMNAKVPPAVLDQITGEISQKNRTARTPDEILANTQSLIRSVCREIRRQNREGLGSLAESVKYHIDVHFAEDLTVAGLAEWTNMPESRFIEQFRQETGTTPRAYLRHVRMKKAADLLTGTRWTVQTIAGEVGIPDANYFVKVFRREYGMTPSAYRKSRGVSGGGVIGDGSGVIGDGS